MLLLVLIHAFSVLPLQLKKLRWHNESAIDLSNANPACGHKEVPRSTGHIMVAARYSDQPRSKSRQKVMRLYKQWHRPISKRFIKYLGAVALTLHTWGPHPLACLLLPCAILHCSLSILRWIPVSRTVWIMLKISTMMVVLSVPFNPNPMHLPLPRPSLYLTHPAVTKVPVTRSVKYKHAPNRWHGKKSLGACCKTKIYHSSPIIISQRSLCFDYKTPLTVWFDVTIIVYYYYYYNTLFNYVLPGTLFLSC